MKNTHYFKQINLFTLMLPIIIFTSCTDDDNQKSIMPVEKSYQFTADLEGWEADFADYSFGEESFYE